VPVLPSGKQSRQWETPGPNYPLTLRCLTLLENRAMSPGIPLTSLRSIGPSRFCVHLPLMLG
jgi:hypothetical protein